MNRKRVLRILISAAAFFLIIAIAALFIPLPPRGRFTNPQVGNLADA